MHEEDRLRLEAVKTQFGSQYGFEVEDPVYVKAISRNRAPDHESAAAIYKAFWFEGDRPRTNSRYVYLNVYDEQRTFQFQVYFDPAAQSITFGKAEHY